MSRAASKVRPEKGRTPSVPAQPPPPSHSPDVVVDIVPGRLTQANWVSMLGQEEGEEVVMELLNELLGRVMDRCYDVYLQNQLVPFTVAKVRDLLVHIIEWNFLNQDMGERPEDTPTWTEDSEALPSATESWAQGCVSVKYATAPKHPLQRTPVPRVTRKTDQRSNQRSWMTAHPSTSPKFSRKAVQSKEPPGYRGYKLPLDPPLKNEEPKKSLTEPSGAKPTLDRLQSSLHSGKGSVVDEEKEGGEEQGEGEERTTDSSFLKPARRSEDFPAMPRVDPAYLPRHRVWPQYEVLDTSPSKQHGRRTREPPAIPGGRRPDRQHMRHAQALKPLISYGAPSQVNRRNDVSGAVWLSLRERHIPTGGRNEGIIPFSGTLMLDTMELAPGVSVKGPQGTRSRPLKGNPAQLEPSAEFRPIRINVPVPVFPLKQLTAGATPRVTLNPKSTVLL